MGLVLIALKSLCGAQPATIIRAIGQLEKRIGLVILPSHGTAAHVHGAWQSGKLSSPLIGAHGPACCAWGPDQPERRLPISRLGFRDGADRRRLEGRMRDGQLVERPPQLRSPDAALASTGAARNVTGRHLPPGPLLGYSSAFMARSGEDKGRDQDSATR
jgi:hypothetical protein